MYQAVIHPPKRQEDTEKLMREIALFRVEKTLKVLREWGVTPEQLQELLKELRSEK